MHVNKTIYANKISFMFTLNTLKIIIHKNLILSNLMNYRVFILSFSLLVHSGEVFRAVISGASDSLKSVMGDAVYIAMDVIDTHIECWFFASSPT